MSTGSKKNEDSSPFASPADVDSQSSQSVARLVLTTPRHSSSTNGTEESWKSRRDIVEDGGSAELAESTCEKAVAMPRIKDTHIFDRYSHLGARSRLIV